MALVTQVAVCTKLRGSELALSVVTEDDLANANNEKLSSCLLTRQLVVCVCILFAKLNKQIFLWYIISDIVILPDSYSKDIVNTVDLV